jgi:hypothetical protein
MTARPELDTESAGLLIRLWFEPDADSGTAVRGRLLAISGTAEPIEVAACAGEGALGDAVRRWLSEQSMSLRRGRPLIEPTS